MECNCCGVELWNSALFCFKDSYNSRSRKLKFHIMKGRGV